MDNTLKIVDVASKTVIASIAGVVPGARPGDCFARECQGLGANAVALSPDERFAYVTSMEAGKLTIVDLGQKKAVSAIATGALPMAVAVTASGKRAYVVNVIDRNVAALDLAAGALAGKPSPFSASGSLDWDEQIPQSVVWLANGEREVWVTNENGTGMVVFQADSMKLIRELDLSNYNHYEASALNATGSAAWVLGSTALDVIDVASKRVIQSTPLCNEIIGAEMMLSPDGKMLAIAELSLKGRFVRLLKLRTMQTVGIYPSVGRVSGLRFSPDGKQLFVTTNPQINKRPAGESFVSIVDLAKSANVAKSIAEDGQFLCPRSEG
jgi:DNA-binding beta-propeller fold protein YncE